jgi:type I restriction enzyme S subunit
MTNLNYNNVVQKLNENMSVNFSSYVKTYLFGSCAKNEAKEDSDIDVLMIFNDLKQEDRFEISGIIGNIEYENNCFMYFKMLKSSDIGKTNPFFIKEAITKGISFERK